MDADYRRPVVRRYGSLPELTGQEGPSAADEHRPS